MSTQTAEVLVSAACRAKLPPAVLERVTESGIMPLSAEDLPPRQVKLATTDRTFPATMKYHRDAYIPTVTPITAKGLVDDGCAVYAPQSLLVMSREAYLADADVKAMPDEVRRVEAAEATLVVVAVIGENRSALSVCRNIASGCADFSALNEDALGAIEASSTFLIEE